MTRERRIRVAWGLLGLGAAVALAHLPGRQAARSGGLVEVAHWLDRPVLLLGTAVLLAAVAGVVGFEFRSTDSQLVGAAVLLFLGMAGTLVLLASTVLDPAEWETDRVTAASRHDRVVTVTAGTASMDPGHRVRLLSGSGWSARHWDLGRWRGFGEPGSFQEVHWSGPDEITVTARDAYTVFTVGPDGRPGEPRTVPRLGPFPDLSSDS